MTQSPPQRSHVLMLSLQKLGFNIWILGDTHSLEKAFYFIHHWILLSVHINHREIINLKHPWNKCWFVVVQSLSFVWLCNPKHARLPCPSLEYISRSVLKLTSTESVMPSNHLILHHLLLLPPSIFPTVRVFSNESPLHTSGQSIGTWASASILPMNI